MLLSNILNKCITVVDVKLENFGWKDGNPVYIDLDSARTPKTPKIFSTRDGFDILDLNYSEAGDLRDLGKIINFY